MLGRPQHPILLCSECGSVGGTDSSVIAVAECPNCGSKSLNRSPRQAPPRLRPLTRQPKFHTASRLRLDVNNDSLTIDIGERISLVGRRSKTVVTERFCDVILDPLNDSD